MINTLNLIATVDINIETPIIYDVSFGNLLIVGPMPSDTTKTPEDFGAYASLSAVLDAGWSVDAEDPVAMAAQVAFSQSPIPNVIYIVPMKTSADSSVVGVGQAGSMVVGGGASSGETAVEAVTRALEYTSWYVLCPAGVPDEQMPALANLIEANERMMVYSEWKYFTNGEHALVDSIYDRTVAIFSAESATQLAEDVPENNKYMNAAFAAKWLFYEPGSETTAFKMLNAVYPADMSLTNVNKLVAKNINYFLKMGNRNVTMLGKTLSGEWADLIRFRDWLKNDMQQRVVNLFIMNPKIPYTDAGIALVQNQMIASLQLGQAMGGIANDEFDEFGNRIPGYATSVPLASSLSPAERNSRRLNRCRFSARLQGAIHFAEIKGSLTYRIQ